MKECLLQIIPWCVPSRRKCVRCRKECAVSKEKVCDGSFGRPYWSDMIGFQFSKQKEMTMNLLQNHIDILLSAECLVEKDSEIFTFRPFLILRLQWEQAKAARLLFLRKSTVISFVFPTCSLRLFLSHHWIKLSIVCIVIVCDHSWQYGVASILVYYTVGVRGSTISCVPYMENVKSDKPFPGAHPCF